MLCNFQTTLLVNSSSNKNIIEYHCPFRENLREQVSVLTLGSGTSPANLNCIIWTYPISHTFLDRMLWNSSLISVKLSYVVGIESTQPQVRAVGLLPKPLILLTYVCPKYIWPVQNLINASRDCLSKLLTNRFKWFAVVCWMKSMSEGNFMSCSNFFTVGTFFS